MLLIRFWRALRSFDQTDRAKFLQFVTGSSKVPLQVIVESLLVEKINNIDVQSGIRSSGRNERSSEVPDSQRRQIHGQTPSSAHLLQSTWLASLRGETKIIISTLVFQKIFDPIFSFRPMTNWGVICWRQSRSVPRDSDLHKKLLFKQYLQSWD